MIRENIYGLPGCQLPDGNLCNICFLYMRVIAMNKELGDPCSNLGESGCNVHNTLEQPPECMQFHCSDVSDNMKWVLLSKARETGLITSHQEAAAKKSTNIVLFFQERPA